MLLVRKQPRHGWNKASINPLFPAMFQAGLNQLELKELKRKRPTMTTMKRDSKMATLIANHVIDMIKLKRADYDKNLQKTSKDKESPVKEAIQKFFDSNPKAFGCERFNAIKLMSALTGFTFNFDAASEGNVYDQYSVITSLVSYSHAGLSAKPGTTVLVGSIDGMVFNPLDIDCTKSAVKFHIGDATIATDEEYVSFMKCLDTQKARHDLVTWIANNGVSDMFFGLKLRE
jgi:hypothetical protein